MTSNQVDEMYLYYLAQQPAIPLKHPLVAWTNDQLRAGYDYAEARNDDILYMAIMQEFERRKLQVVDPE